jgi:hypothetical protein
LFGLIATFALPDEAGIVVAVMCDSIALAATLIVCACAVILVRYQRAMLGEEDLFLQLNRSRDPEAIRAGAVRRAGAIRRWLARRLLGHDLLVGDLVEVKSWDEIRLTLDQNGGLDELPFMPEMRQFCGQRAYVFRCMHRLFDYRKSRRMRHMDGAVLLVGAVCDGAHHGGCDATCHLIWKASWLRRPGEQEADAARITSVQKIEYPPPAVPAAVRYTCQLTQLHAASVDTKDPSLANFLRPLVSGNVAPAAFLVGVLTLLFEEVQQRRGGVGFPSFEALDAAFHAPQEDRLAPGDEVIVKDRASIRATLNERLIHKGMGFEPDMLKHCGRRYRVTKEVKRVIDIVNGELRTMKTPAYLLDGVHFSGERQFFNAQYEPLFWRAAWLRREPRLARGA